ncbi:MAG TPA: creatininase family protein [Tepidisphaeraceae bacterium]|jgi:creatinine amidohydrolase
MAASFSESLNIQDLGAAAVREKLAGDGGARTVLIPIGSCERHGNPYTPLGLDGIVTDGVVQRAAHRTGVLHTPLMPFGYAPHHVGRAGEGHGTVTLRAETYRRILEDIGRSLIFQGFDKLIFVSFHSFNVDCGQEVLFSLRHKTGALAAFFGGRESGAAAEILDSPPERLANDVEAAIAMALMGDRFNTEAFLSHGYEIHAPAFLGKAFSKRAGSGMAVSFKGQENIEIGMDDYEFVRPIEHGHRPIGKVTAEKGRKLLDTLSDDLAAFVEEIKKVRVEVHEREFSDRAR